MKLSDLFSTQPGQVVVEFSKGPVEIIEEFQRGCVETNLAGVPASHCRECFMSAVIALTRQGFTGKEASALLKYQRNKKCT